MRKNKEIFKIFEDVSAAEQSFFADVSGFSADERIARRLAVPAKKRHGRLRTALISLCAVFIVGIAVIPAVYSAVKQSYFEAVMVEQMSVESFFSLAASLGVRIPAIEGHTVSDCSLTMSRDGQQNLLLGLTLSENNTGNRNIDLTIVLQKDYIYSMSGMFAGLTLQTVTGGVTVDYKFESGKLYAKFSYSGFVYYITATEENTNLLDDIVQSLACRGERAEEFALLLAGHSPPFFEDVCA